MFYPRTAAEVLALDVLHDSAGQPITRAAVEHHLGRTARAPTELPVLALPGGVAGGCRLGVEVLAGVAADDDDCGAPLSRIVTGAAAEVDALT